LIAMLALLGASGTAIVMLYGASMQERLRLLRAVDPAGLSSDEREARKRSLSRDSRRLRRLQLRLRGAALRGAISPGRRSRHV